MKGEYMKSVKLIICFAASSLFVVGSAFGFTEETTTIESHVVEMPSSSSTKTTTYTILGPQDEHYSIVASPSEVQRIQTIVRTNPQAMIRFNGDVEEIGGKKYYRVREWEDTASTSKKTTLDSNGNKTVTEKTTTHIGQ